MKPILCTDNVLLVRGDALDVLRKLDDNSIDSMVTDPPAGIGFMGKEWDSDKGGRQQWIDWLAEIMREALRVLKPGAHGLVWAIPRTSHWTATACELAGFEIRDRVSHFFGTGFPKSLNVSKAIDKALGAKREIVGFSKQQKQQQTPAIATNDYGDYKGQSGDITAAGSPEAKQWEGYGTALKPACEDWWLIRKPLDGTVAANVLEHGTGGINVDACRIGNESLEYKTTSYRDASTGEFAGQGQTNHTTGRKSVEGRWPANITLDPEAAALLDAQAGASTSTKGKPRKGKSGDGYGMTHTGAEYEDKGGPSRYFYVAKPSRAERDAGLEHLAASTGGEATGRVDGSAGTQNPRAGAGRTGGARNIHPTVKSTALMTWLIRLITPAGGCVLDPFAGSGSTGIAAVAGGWSFVGIEREENFAEIAKSRIVYATKKPE